MSSPTIPSGWRSMASAPKDGSTILVCELLGNGNANVLPACYMRPQGDKRIEGFWGAAATSRVLPHVMEAAWPNDPNPDRMAVDWRCLAMTPLCWRPLPDPEDIAVLRRRQGQILRFKHVKRATK